MNTSQRGLEFTKAALIDIAGDVQLEADLILPSDPKGVVLLVHGSGSSRLSPRNRFIARMLRDRGLATLLLDTETPSERVRSIEEGHPSIPLSEMADRIVRATAWLQEDSHVSGLPIGYFGAGTGAAATFIAAAEQDGLIRGIVSRGGRLELARHSLSQVVSPALLIVGARDVGVVHCNRDAYDSLASKVKRLELIPGARHMFEEPGTLAAAAMHAGKWFARHLPDIPEELPGYAIVEGP